MWESDGKRERGLREYMWKKFDKDRERVLVIKRDLTERWIFVDGEREKGREI